MSSIYQINKGINNPIEFKGLKAQYIWYLGGGLVALLILFAILYICGVNVFLCLIIIVTGGSVLFMQVYKLSSIHGEHGLMKKIAARSVPKMIRFSSMKRIQKRLAR